MEVTRNFRGREEEGKKSPEEEHLLQREGHCLLAQWGEGAIGQGRDATKEVGSFLIFLFPTHSLFFSLGAVQGGASQKWQEKEGVGGKRTHDKWTASVGLLLLLLHDATLSLLVCRILGFHSLPPLFGIGRAKRDGFCCTVAFWGPDGA